MLTKLVFKNVGKSFHDYAVYFFTLVVGVSVFYMFNSIYAQQDMMAVTQTTDHSMASLTKILSYISVFVAVILGFLIVYANNFFIRRRKKELGIYMTLGMSKGKISTVLVLETAMMAVVAMIVGLLVGVFGSQFMSVFTAKIFEADMTGYKFIFSPSAAWKSVIYFGIIFLTVIIFNIYFIGKYKLIDLIHGSRKNENIATTKTYVSILVFIFSILCLACAYVIILNNGIIEINMFFFTSIMLGLIGTLTFFFSLANILTRSIQKKKSLYFKNLNMFVLRQISSKINTNFISISVISIVLLLVIGIFSCGYSLQNVLSKDLKSTVLYDFTLYRSSYDGMDIAPLYDSLPEELKAFKGIRDKAEYTLYEIPDNRITLGDLNISLGSDMINTNDDNLNFLSYGDYKKLCELTDVKPIALEKNQYAVLCSFNDLQNVADQLINNNTQINLNDTQLYPVSTKIDISMINTINFYQIVLIVDDSFVTDYPIVEKTLNIQCKNDNTEYEFYTMLKDYWENMPAENEFFLFRSKIEYYEASVTTKAIISFLAIYLGIVFMIACAAILAIQQLSEAADNKERYDLLAKLGTDKKMINQALFTQILCYFLFPLLLAIVHSAVGITAANEVIKLFGKVDIMQSILVTAGFVILIYGGYFAITYMGSKNVINR